MSTASIGWCPVLSNKGIYCRTPSHTPGILTLLCSRAQAAEAPHVPFAQMIARIHTSVVPVRRMIHGLLIRIGRHHPQAR